MKKNILSYFKSVILVFSLCLLVACNKPVIYVSASGKDTNAGTKNAPLASIEKALELSRIDNKKQILIKKGSYYDVSVSLSEQDSGLIIQSEDEGEVYLFGGKPIQNWQQEGEWYVANLPGSGNRSWDIQSLIVNDSLRDRSKFPEEGTFQSLNKWPHRWQSSQGGWAKKPTYDELTTLYYNPEDFNYFDVHNAEISVIHVWDESYVAVENIDTINHSIRFSYPTTHPSGAWNRQDYVVWNVKEGMTKPGQWFLDRANEKIYYWPFSHEQISNFSALVPTKDFVFNLKKGADNITIRDINISCAGIKLKNPNYASGRLDAGAVRADSISNLLLEDVEIKNTSGWAVFIENSSDVRVKDCEVSNTGAGGIRFSGTRISVENSGIHDVGKLFLSSVGILGKGSNNNISHCELYNLPYCAINGIGDHSLAEYNLIYNFKQHLEDGGAIYCNKADSTIYQHNATLLPVSSGIEGRTYYFDELSNHCKIYNNLAVNTLDPAHIHMANNIEVTNNLFYDQGLQIMGFRMSSNLRFINNTFIADTVIFSGPNGEPLTVKKESLNAIYQKFYEASGIVEMTGNKFYANAVQEQFVEIYTRKRQSDLPVEDLNDLSEPKSKNEFLEMIPEKFNQTGYRNNFWEVLEKMISG
ncbi:hypothetical protein GM418_27165 [Maribellus comscasis]|uniref:Right handed beta helix domain-containing protein n=1 Tax=Maribellus comscasis TaxID=2681766 RepID=A0A6I6JXD3_9BACT|nr:right-handed parallel beta-helix repeat-containing protein [Maribellus comscasis]QGY47211.1 hypothetical protein GM418_27165 [Maribellus comscasis]